MKEKDLRCLVDQIVFACKPDFLEKLLADKSIGSSMWNYVEKPNCENYIKKCIATLSYSDMFSLWNKGNLNRDVRGNEHWIIGNTNAKKELTSYIRHKICKKAKQTTLFLVMGCLTIGGFWWWTFTKSQTRALPPAEEIASNIINPN